MARRNAMHDRYQNPDKAPEGKTRKSAASAKPVAKAGASVYQRKSGYKPKKKLGERIFGSGNDEKTDKELQRIERENRRANKKVETSKDDSQSEKKSKRMTIEDLTGDTSIPEPKKNMTELEKEQAEARYRNPGTPEFKKWRKIWAALLVCGMICVLVPVIFQYQFEGNAGAQTMLLIVAMMFLIAAIGIDATKIRSIRRAARAGIRVSQKPKTKAEKRELERKQQEEERKLAEKVARREARREKIPFARKKDNQE